MYTIRYLCILQAVLYLNGNIPCTPLATCNCTGEFMTCEPSGCYILAVPICMKYSSYILCVSYILLHELCSNVHEH